jgi:NAD-dependent SIR2 family protein deacetylase
MSTTPHSDDAAGSCPTCGSPIPSERVLIEYERSGGPAAFAECPDCQGVVRPE